MGSQQLGQFKKALEEFLPYAQKLESETSMLEGKLEGLAKRRAVAENELRDQLDRNKIVINAEREKINYVLYEAQNLLAKVQALVFELEKSRVNGQPQDNNLDKAREVLNELTVKSKKIKELAIK